MEDESSSSSVRSCLFVSIDPMRDSQCLEALTHDDLFSSNSPSPNDIPSWLPLTDSSTSLSCILPPSRLPCYVFCICLLTNKYQKYKSVELGDQLPPSQPVWHPSLAPSHCSRCISRTEAGQLWPGSGHHNALITPHDNTATEFETTQWNN